VEAEEFQENARRIADSTEALVQMVAEIDYIVVEMVAEEQILAEVVEMLYMAVDSIVHSV
jgi:hypothetical protein